MDSEKKVGFFNQFAYAVRGIVRPKYFNRMTGQKVFNIIVFVIVLSFITNGIFWGFQYLKSFNSKSVKDFINFLPEFTYSNGQLTLPEDFMYQNEKGNKVYYGFTDVEDAYNCDIYNIKSRIDLTDGKEKFILTGNAIIQLDKITGNENYISYDPFYNFISIFCALPDSFSKGDVRGIIASNMLRIIAVLAGISFIITIFLSFTVVPLILGAIGFGLNKLLHGDYRYKELYFVSIYIYCMVNFLKLPFRLISVPRNLLMWLGFAGMLAYLYFALTGSRTEIGNASSINLGKKEPKFDDDFGFTGGGFAAPDPLETRKTASPYYAKKEKPAAPAYAREAEPSPSVIVAEVPTPSVPVMEEQYSYGNEQAASYNNSTYGYGTEFTQTGYEEPQYTEPVYEEAQYSEPVYEEPRYAEPVYEEAQYSEPVYEEPEVSQSDLVFGNMSGGINTISSVSGGIGGSTYNNSGGSYAGSSYGGAGNYVSRNTSSHIGGYHDPAYDMPMNDSLSGFANEPLPKLNASYGGTFSMDELGSSLLGSSTFAVAGQSTFGGSSYGSNFGGGSSYGSTYGGSSFGRAKDEPLLKSTGSGSQADKDFEEWERQHYGNR